MFFSLVVAPSLISVLGEGAGRALRAIYPRYYFLGAVCAVVLAAVQVARGFLWYWGGMIKPAIVVFTLLACVQIYAHQVLAPASRRGLVLNGFTLLFGLLYLIWMAMRGY